MVIGNARGSGPNRVFIGAPFRNVDYPGACTPSLKPNTGEVAEIDVLGFATQFSVQPALDPGGACPSVGAFGQAVDIGLVNNDSVPDLIVGAEDSESKKGRVYVYFGGANFPNDWVAFRSESTGPEWFGASVAIADLDGVAGHDAIVVGAPERFINNAPGRAYVIPNWVVAALPLGQVSTLSDTRYQVLTDNNTGHDWYGWNVFAIGDMGDANDGTFDGFGDIAVHSEDTDRASASNAGALYIYFGMTPEIAPDFVRLVKQAPLKMQGAPSAPSITGERFGRSAARVEWKTTAGDVKVGLLVGAPDAKLSPLLDHAGRVFLFYAPLKSTYDNAWGSTVLQEPDPSPPHNPLPTAYANFGLWISVGVYNSTFTGQQFVVSARNRKETTSVGSSIDVGRVYAFRAP